MESTQIRLIVPPEIDMTRLLGHGDGLLRIIEDRFESDIAVRGNEIVISGGAVDSQSASALFSEMIGLIERGEHLTIDTIERSIDLLTIGDHTPTALHGDVILTHKGKAVRPKTGGQKRYVDAIRSTTVTFGIGPAGTGKTYLAVACAVDALERDAVKRIVLTRPAVEAGERLGFLPGDLAQKVDPYLRPLYDALYDLMGFDKVMKLIERNTIEVAPLAFMRGRTLNHAFIILDEAQNTTPEQMQMFLTRIGFGAKAVVTGDITQIDLPKGIKSGLKDAQEVLADVRGIAFTNFTKEDVVRHPLVARIVDAYAKHRKA